MRNPLLALLFALVLFFATGCGGDSSDEADNERRSATTADPQEPDTTVSEPDGSGINTAPISNGPEPTSPDPTSPNTTSDVPGTTSPSTDGDRVVYEGTADVGGAVEGIDFSDVAIDRPLAGCESIDADALSAITGFDYYVRNSRDNPPASPYRGCTIYDNDDGAMFYIGVAPDQGFSGKSIVFASEVGFASVDGLGDAAGWQADDDFTHYATLRVDVGEATLLIAGRYRDGDDYTEASYEDLVQVLHEAYLGLTGPTNNVGIGTIDTCDDLRIADIDGSPVDGFEEFDFNGVYACVGEAESGDRMAIRLDMWRRSDRYLDNIVEDYERVAIRPELEEVDALDDRFERGVFGEDVALYPLGRESEQVYTDEAFFIGDEVFIHVSVAGQAALDDAYSEADLQDIALDVLYGDDPTNATLRYQSRSDFVNAGDCGIWRGSGPIEIVSCDEPHDFEGYASEELPDGPYPDADGDFVPCYSLFEDYTGVPIGESGMFNYPSWPEVDDWDDGYRDLHCLAVYPGVPTGELKDFDFAAGSDGYIPWSSITPDTCVLSEFDFDDVAVLTSDCTGDEEIDILGMVDPADGDIFELCATLATDEGYDEGLVETSSILEQRGFTPAICWAALT